MQKLKQSFHNSTDRPQFINLELSTGRFRLNPNEELILFYDAADVRSDVAQHRRRVSPDLLPAPG